MILGFKPQFKQKILDGTKIHTIREDKTDKWNTGNVIHFATGVRTKQYDCFQIGKCHNIQDIRIIYYSNETDYPVVRIDGAPYYAYEKKGIELLERLAINDGFDSFDDFCKWFSKDFDGKIIHWTNFKY